MRTGPSEVGLEPAAVLGPDDSTDARRRPRDAAALLIAVTMLGLALLVGFRAASGSTWDVDERVYRDALVSMRAGDGPYEAMREALVRKEGAAPSNPRAYRTPTLAYLQAALPFDALRWFVAVPFGVMLWAAWRIGRPHGSWGGPISVGLVGFWIIGASPLLYLHHEVWGAALLLAGLAVVDRRPRLAAVLLGAATAVRELFASAFAVGLYLHRRSRTWWAVAGVLAVGAVVHLTVASRYLDPDGYQPPLAWDGLQLNSIAPSGSVPAIAIGFVGGSLGLAGAAILARRGSDSGRIALVHAVLGLLVSVTVGREYWGLAWGPAIACYAPVAIEGLAARTRHTAPLAA
jgi:hypothetical protein